MSDKPPDDPTRWYPLGQYVEDEDNYSGNRVGVADDDDGGQTFTLAREDMAALNRFTQTGRMLPMTRNGYEVQMGLTSEAELTDQVWNAVDTMLLTFKTINNDCNSFLSEEGNGDAGKGTWAKTVDVAAQIWTYSDNAGGEAGDSFYESMLAAVNAFNEATNEDDKNAQKDLIKEYTDMQKKDCSALATAAETVETELGAFQTRCSGYATELTGHEKTMEGLLQQEYGDIECLKADIEKQTAIIKSKQSKIDADRLIEKQEAYYEWIPFVGAIAAAIVTAVMETNIADLEDAIKKLQDIIASDQEKIRVVGAVQGHVTGMKTEIHELNDVLTPAITTLGKLKGAWQAMGTMLDALNAAFSKANDEIDYPSIEKNELDKIRRKWNDLRSYTQTYQEVAYLTDVPKATSFGQYLDELEQSKKSLN
ncbi:hypothetical protein P170DRAFT_514200 [Aspergillus steynii IBT 23096]|uniref:Uncharacterized protein n=1 Tax=Aspergillus steynii IBT 23096 TaxID=1392250 RepID=A0A2I2FTE9_9EURO|nr:uncharacterized protein P170DRAFT_514200 [Aspergillus steynii IBT 23096]PLB43894.1 hypothetical protein P170DRAFT_514200 [Aspergillus steynii IBT 23096]